MQRTNWPCLTDLSIHMCQQRWGSWYVGFDLFCSCNNLYTRVLSGYPCQIVIVFAFPAFVRFSSKGSCLLYLRESSLCFIITLCFSHNWWRPKFFGRNVFKVFLQNVCFKSFLDFLKLVFSDNTFLACWFSLTRVWSRCMISQGLNKGDLWQVFAFLTRTLVVVLVFFV